MLFLRLILASLHRPDLGSYPARGESDQITQNLRTIGEPDTSAALDFYNQLTTAQLLLQIETSDAAFRLDELHEYLAKNY